MRRNGDCCQTRGTGGILLETDFRHGSPVCTEASEKAQRIGARNNDKSTTGQVHNWKSEKNNQTTGQTGQLHLLEDEQQQKRTFHAGPNEARSAHTEPKATK